MGMNKYIKITASAALLLLLAILPAKSASAKVLDEILDYTITVDVNDDATLKIQYDVSWKVLDSKSEGPLEWASIGLSNRNYSDILGLTPNIKYIDVSNSGGTNAEIHFDKKYYKDEVVDFSFQVTMDNMYSAYPDDGYVEYVFTPGWFDNIDVDNLTIRWQNDNSTGWSPDCLVDGGYNVWNTSLKAGEKYTVTMKYPPEAYAFDMNKKQKDSSLGYSYEKEHPVQSAIASILTVIIVLVSFVFGVLPFSIPALIFYFIFKKGRGFTPASDKKVTRTVVEYYPSCPNCGGSREEGKDVCAYCGSNMIKSKHEVTEEDVKQEDKGALSFNTDGEFRFSDNPNKYVRVHVVPVPIAHSVARSVASSGRGGGSHHSSCAHSSCAHSSCACACACACAGGGRAGCTTKDFYNTDFKLSYLNKYKG